MIAYLSRKGDQDGYHAALGVGTIREVASCPDDTDIARLDSHLVAHGHDAELAQDSQRLPGRCQGQVSVLILRATKRNVQNL